MKELFIALLIGFVIGIVFVTAPNKTVFVNGNKTNGYVVEFDNRLYKLSEITLTGE